MKHARILFCMICALAYVPAFSSAEWPNEPAGAVTLYDCPFSNTICGMGNTYNTQAYANFSNAPLSPSSVFDTYMAAGSSTGNGQWGINLQNAKEIYLGTWWSTNADFVGMCNNTNKMFFIRRPEIDNNFFQWQRTPGSPGNLVWSNQATYDDNHLPGTSGMCYTCGDGTGSFGTNAGSKPIAAGSGWHRIELYLKTSTTKTSRDGILRWWVDGQLIGNYPGVNLSPGGFQEFILTHTWDGSSCLVPPYRDMTKAWHHYWDHLRISIPNGAPEPVLPLAITSPLQTSARVGSFYTSTLGAANGKASYGWTISAGSLPPGLTLNKSTGVLSGTPTTIGRSDFTVKVMDSSVPAAEATKAFSIIVSRSTGIGKRELMVNGLQLMVEPLLGTVRFHLSQPGAYVLCVYDLAGKKVYEHKANTSGQKEMRVETALKNGIYFAKFSQGRDMSTVRFSIMN